jgi:hypothetical protein
LKPLNKERIIAASILVSVLIFFFYVIPNYIEISEEYEAIGLSPAFFPNIATIFIGALAALFLLLTFTKKWSHFFNSEGESGLSPSEELKAVLCSAIIIGYLFALKYTGYFVSTPPVLFGLLFIQGERKIFKSIIIVLVVTFGVYFIFHNFLNVQFPEGKLFK